MAGDAFDLLGRSLIADEYRGDYSAAHRAAEEAVNAAADRSTRSRALLTRALVEVLAGAPGAALRTLDSLLGMSPQGDLFQFGSWIAQLAQAQHGDCGIDGSLRAGAPELVLLDFESSARSRTPGAACAQTWEDVPVSGMRDLRLREDTLFQGAALQPLLAALTARTMTGTRGRRCRAGTSRCGAGARPQEPSAAPARGGAG